MPRDDLPSGTVTLLFTDVVGSTQALRTQGTTAYAASLAEHRSVVRTACKRHSGVEVDTQGDAFFVVFADTLSAVAAAREAQEVLESGPLRVRMGLHTGEPVFGDEGYVGDDVHLAARIAAAAHGGQVVMSDATARLLDASLPIVDLGEHRLKDFDEPVSLFQLGTAPFPPLRTISNTNLPRPISSFIGRQKELDDVTALVAGSRLVTLTGPGGSGKTRLAIEAAAQLVPQFKAGVFWVGLATLRDPAFVIETIGQTLGAKAGVTTHIAERELLLLLDNLEQLTEAAVDLSTLLSACPNLHLLVTSRELLRIDGETGYEVLPLAEREAVDLYCARSRAAETDGVRPLCQALDCLPLAVELAAARAWVLSAEQILQRLSSRLDLFRGRRDADARQQTLRATIEWSYELLTPDEQALFARLSVFEGGSTLEAAETVADADPDTLQALVEKSLLRQTDERFWMLETIREYALERLEERGELDSMRRRGAEHLRALTDGSSLTPYGGIEPDALTKELPNLRASVEWALESHDLELALGLAADGGRAWVYTGAFAEGHAFLSRVLDATVRLETRDRAAALARMAELDLQLGEFERATVLFGQSHEIYRRLDDRAGAIDSLLGGAYAAAETGQIDRARVLERQARLLATDAGDEHRVADAHLTAAQIEGLAGDYGKAEALLQEGLGLYRKLGLPRRSWSYHLINVGWFALQQGEFARAIAALDEYLGEDMWKNPVGIANAHSNLGLIALLEGDPAQAASHFSLTLTISQDAPAAPTIAEALQGTAVIAASDGDTQRATRLWGAANAIRHRMNTRPTTPEADLELRHLTLLRVGDHYAATWAAGQQLAVEDAVAEALAVCTDVISRSPP